MAAAREVPMAINADLLENSSESDSDDDHVQTKVPFTINEIPERLLFQRTRLNRRVFHFVLGILSPILDKNTKKGRYAHLTSMHKLYVALQFYATGSFQWLIGSSGRISQSATSTIITEVTNALVEVAPRFIRFPTAEEYPAVKHDFYVLGMTRHGIGFPNVLAAIDCTHVRLRAPTNVPEQYLNRHLYYSINVQLLVGPNLKIFNVFAEYPGSNHDAFIWRNSTVRDVLAAGNHFPEGWLVGDSGYPQEPWLITPVINVTTAAEQLYNAVHISTRNPVERTNGVLKRRWQVLDSSLAYNPTKVCAITTASCVLHNICTDYNLEVEGFQDHPLNDDFPCQELPNHNNNNCRENLIAQHFSQ